MSGKRQVIIQQADYDLNSSLTGGSLFHPHPLDPPLLQRRGGRNKKEGFTPLKLPFFKGGC